MVVVGVFHIEASLGESDIPAILDEITKLNTDIEYFITSVSITLGINITLTGKQPAIFIVAYSIETQQAVDNLKTELRNLNPRIPVYLIYIDENNRAQGECFGPGCSQAVLNQTSIDMLGVGLGEIVPGLQPPPEDTVEEIIVTAICDPSGICIEAGIQE
ncbi:MAG: hypothetical protein A2Z21_02165 [Candidatus Fraserbacteria bacterium RBG_16_55_9]|uniref:Uncharacterized protein n=1 Tax=Fraserbacteria sp. (strain RBG_16_55_9) TaxID=1817864 RepID=A0A1F5V1C8_FRAXR|nr:MAG: hypothetical protein A2Z21_02165 [Candidatus Fraserbacteria bacterium RBG_16_55_9]